MCIRDSLFALANCFFGYKLQKVWIALIGFLIGLVGGFAAGMAPVSYTHLDVYKRQMVFM